MHRGRTDILGESEEMGEEIKTFLGLADMADPPEGYEKYIWSCSGCVKGIQWCVEHKKKYDILPDPWDREAKVDNAIEYLKSVRIQILDALKKEISEYLDVNYEDNEWFILLSTWLREYLTSCYDKYLRLKKIKDFPYRLDCYIYNTDFGTPQVDHADYFEKSMSDDSYNMLLYSELISGLKNDLRNVKCTEIDKPMDLVDRNVSRSRYKTTKNILMMFSNAVSFICLFFPRKYIIINMKSTGIGLKLLLKLNFKLGVTLLPIFTPYKVIKHKVIDEYMDKEWRCKPLKIDSGGDVFVDLIKKNIKKEIPIVYVESHKKLTEYVNLHFGGIKRADAYLSGAAFIYDELDRLLLLKMRREGKMLCGLQHGGNYGVEKYWLHEDEFQVYDKYYTWGWKKSDEADKFVSMPSFFMHRSRVFSVEHGEHTDMFLYVSYTQPCYFSRFDRMETVYKSLIKDGEMLFLKSLSEGMRRRTIVRLFPADYGWNCREDLKREIPDITFDKELKLYDSARKASLVIVCDWQTVFIEMLALGKPVLVLCDGSYIIEEAKKNVELLWEVGIAHKNWDSIKEQMEEIDGKVQEWWEEPRRQKVINKIKYEYAWMTGEAESIWVKELKRIQNQSVKSAVSLTRDKNI